MSDTIRVAALQMNCQLADIAANLAQAETLLMVMSWLWRLKINRLRSWLNSTWS